MGILPQNTHVPMNRCAPQLLGCERHEAGRGWAPPLDGRSRFSVGRGPLQRSFGQIVVLDGDLQKALARRARGSLGEGAHFVGTLAPAVRVVEEAVLVNRGHDFTGTAAAAGRSTTPFG